MRYLLRRHSASPGGPSSGAAGGGGGGQTRQEVRSGLRGLTFGVRFYLFYLFGVAGVGVPVHVLVRLFFISALVLVHLLRLRSNNTGVSTLLVARATAAALLLLVVV